MASKSHRIMTPCHFVGIEKDCQCSRSYRRGQRCTHQAFGEFCRNIEIQKQLQVHEPRFVTENAISFHETSKEIDHETDPKFGFDPAIADALEYFGLQPR